jgi:hypothetical protein
MNIRSTTERVPENTMEHVNDRIQIETECRLKYYADHPEEIEDRLWELDQEWDIERTIEANASALVISGLLLGTFVNRRFFLLPAVVTAFLLPHSIQGWCPPVPIFRRLGMRTQFEIEQERYALKTLRGDFEEVGENVEGSEAGRRLTAEQAFQAVRR